MSKPSVRIRYRETRGLGEEEVEKHVRGEELEVIWHWVLGFVGREGGGEE